MQGRPASLEISFPTVPTVFGISPHGILAAGGILTGLWVLGRTLDRRGLSRDAPERAVMWAIPAGILGARLDYVISHPANFSSPLAAFEVWKGGLALFGGLLAGSATALVVLTRSRVDVRRVFDAAAIPMAVAIAVGRVGDILLGDHLGRPVDGSAGIGFRIQPGSAMAPGFTPSPAVVPTAGETCADVGRFYAGCSYHMSAAYDLLASVLIAGALVLLTRKTLRAPGLQMAAFAYLYASQRLALDSVRGIDERILFGLSGTQLLAVTVIAGAIAAVGLLAREEAARGQRSGGLPATQDVALGALPSTSTADAHARR